LLDAAEAAGAPSRQDGQYRKIRQSKTTFIIMLKISKDILPHGQTNDNEIMNNEIHFDLT
jgi:hypothetical protein